MKSKPRSIKESTSPRFRASAAELVVSALLLAPAAFALQPAVGHVELNAHYQTSNGTWTWPTNWFDDDLNFHTDEIGTLFIPGDDAPPGDPDYGTRNDERPPGPEWDFLGMAGGEPVWIFESNSRASLGFYDTQADLTGNLVFSLDSVTGPEDGHFSMFFGSAPTVHMKTIDGVDGTDVFSKPLQHTHVNWAFSKKGLWIVKLKVRGTVKSTGALTSQSPPQPLVFAIGDHAIWKASRFTMAELQNAAVSGDPADPDGDGWNNLMEYALGGDPHVASTLRTDDGQALAPRLLPPASAGAPWRFCYFRRTAAHGTEIAYEVESSNSLGSPPWDGETGSEEILFSDDSWQQICIPLGIPQGAEKSCFFRLKISTMP